MLLCFESFRLHIFEWKGVKCSGSRMIQNGNYYEASRLRHQHEPIQIVAVNVFIFIIWYDSGFMFINIPDMYLGIHFIGKFTNMKETWHRCYITTRLINMNSISNYARCEFWILPTNRYRYGSFVTEKPTFHSFILKLHFQEMSISYPRLLFAMQSSGTDICHKWENTEEFSLNLGPIYLASASYWSGLFPDLSFNLCKWNCTTHIVMQEVFVLWLAPRGVERIPKE